MPWIKEESCAGCGVCMYYCSAEAISMNDRRVAVIDEGKCAGCAKCFEICPADAIKHNSER